MNNNLINKDKLMISLTQCKDLTLKSFEVVINFLENYPIDVNMDRIKEQINNMNVSSEIKKDVTDILNKGGV